MIVRGKLSTVRKLCATALCFVLLLARVALLLGGPVHGAETNPRPETVVEFVVTSDVHYGILRGKFRGQAAVESRCLKVRPSTWRARGAAMRLLLNRAIVQSFTQFVVTRVQRGP